MLAVMGMMVIFAIGLLAVAPAVQQEVQREKELESIRRGEEIAEAIRRYISHYQGQKLPESIDDLLEGLPTRGTKKEMILRPSAATDPLSPDGKWILIGPDPKVIAAFAKRIETYNNGMLPGNPQPQRIWDRFAVDILVNVNTDAEDEADDETFDVMTDNKPFIGVASQSRAKSVIAYYGIERHSKWIFTPLFRGSGAARGSRRNSNSQGFDGGTTTRQPGRQMIP